MADDIVTRLRYRAKVCNHGLSPNAPEGTEVYITIPCDRCEPLTQAADEIERLQAENKDILATIPHIVKGLQNGFAEHIERLQSKISELEKSNNA